MGKRVLVGVQKKRPTKRNKKTLLKKIIDYLKSDSYMYAPLISPPPSDFGSPNITSSSATGVEFKEPNKEKKKRLLKKVWKYLKTDSYMYAPLVVSKPESPPTTGPSRYLKRVTMEVTTRQLTMKDYQPSNQSENAIAEDLKKPCEGYLPDTSETLGHGEMVKHMVYQYCRSSSMSGYIPLVKHSHTPGFLLHNLASLKHA